MSKAFKTNVQILSTTYRYIMPIRHMSLTNTGCRWWLDWSSWTWVKYTWLLCLWYCPCLRLRHYIYNTTAYNYHTST